MTQKNSKNPKRTPTSKSPFKATGPGRTNDQPPVNPLEEPRYKVLERTRKPNA